MGDSKKPEDYYFFNAIWEYYLLVMLCVINGKLKWAIPIYIMQCLAISLNIASYILWEDFAETIYYWYDIANKVLIESTILALISKDNKKGILLICFLMIATPYILS